MLVVKRAFRNFGQVLTPGTVVKAEDIKWCKSRIHHGQLVEVTDDTIDRWADYFRVKCGKDIKPVKAQPVKVQPVKAIVK